MRPKPLASIIIIFLNEDKFIREALESVFSQTYDTWELLLVDDGSTDASPDIARWYVERRAGKVRYLAHEGHQNRGMSASRNLGISHAGGEYIAFLDADDVWFPEKLEQQATILESHSEAAMVYGPGQMWYSWTGNAEDRQRDSVPQQTGVPIDRLIRPPTLLPLIFRSEIIDPFAGGILVRRTAIHHVGGFELAFPGMFEDFVFCTKLCLEFPVFVASQCWYRWRRHPDSCVTVALRTGQYNSAWLAYLNWLEAYLLRQQIEEPEVWAALHKELCP